jgi:predicted nucleotidyltransferase
MAENNYENLKFFLKDYPQIKLAYLFGSKASGEEGPLSDYDFAFYLDEKDEKKMFGLKFALMDELGRFLKSDKVDVVILNLVEGPELKYNIIKEGRLIYEVEPFRVIVEPKILNEYFDFRQILLKYGLTRA